VLHGPVASDSRTASVAHVPTATLTAGRGARDGPVDGGPHRGLDQVVRAVRARPVQQVVADVLEGDDVVGDDLA
jgi:hypothetical protein